MNAAAEARFWDSLDDESAYLNTAGNPPYNIVQVGVKILNNVDPLRLLDLGCGMGRLTNAIARRIQGEGVVHGVDISPRMVGRAAMDANQHHLSNVHYWRGDGRHLPYGLPRRFTGAYSIAMFQHTPYIAMWDYLREVCARLEPGGTFVFTIAVGATDEFLNHQIASPKLFADDLLSIYDQVEMEVLDERGWTWVTARKEV